MSLFEGAGVPVALATDDEGVSRSEMTREYERAVADQGLDYATLKKMARTSLEHSFLPGASLWSYAHKFTPRNGTQSRLHQIPERQRKSTRTMAP